MRKVRHLLLFTYQSTDHLLYWLERWGAFAGTPPSGVHPRSSAEGEEGGREESRFTTQQPDRPKEGEEDFNSYLDPISLAGTNKFIKYWSYIYIYILFLLLSKWE